MRVGQIIMDSFYDALSQFRCRHYHECVDICTNILEKQPLDQATWCLKMRALTMRGYLDDIDGDDMAGDFLDENNVATAPRPGTSIKTLTSATTVNLR